MNDRIKLLNSENSLYDEEHLTQRQKNKIDTANRKWEIIKEAKELYTEGNTKTYIARKLNISRITLNTYLSLTDPPIKDSDCILDPFIPFIKELIIDGKRTKEIYEKIKEKGYKGKMTVLNMHMKSIRTEIKNNTTYLKRSKIKKLFFYDIDDIKDHNLKNDLQNIPAFYGRGAWDEENMTLKDRALCKLLQKAVAKKPPDTYEPWMQALMNALGQK